jgi:hypothetical protein
MPPLGFEPTISAGERLHTYALDRVATGTDDIRFQADELHNFLQLEVNIHRMGITQRTNITPVKVIPSSQTLAANVLPLVCCVAVLNMCVPSREI